MIDINNKIQLCDASVCTGCKACGNVCGVSAINFVENKEGFFYPQINESTCVKCGKCMVACPVLHSDKILKHNVQNKLYAAWAKDDNLRLKSSSGGLFSIFAEHILSCGGIVFGAMMDDNMKVFHVGIEYIEDLYKLRGSKYVQSDIRNVFKEAKCCLKTGRKVLFTGTPCQVAGLYASLGKMKDNDNLFTVDIICHGVPSQKSFDYYISQLNNRLNDTKIVRFSFRDAGGWSCSCSCSCSSGNTYKIGYKDNLYMQLFLKSLLHRESCYTCTYASMKRVSDITIGDFWGIGSKVPFDHDVSKGCSLMIINTGKGEMILDKIKSKIFMEERLISEAIVVNEQLREPCRRPAKRSEIYDYLYTHDYLEVGRRYVYTPYHRIRHAVGEVLRFFKLK